MYTLRTMLALLCALILVGCAASTSGSDAGAEEHAPAREERVPELTAVNLADGERLQVIATTNIVADVVAQVGGDAIELTGLMPIGADPHSFEPAPSDIVALNAAQVIFINGLHLEESLDPLFDSLDGAAALVSVNAGVETIEFGGEVDAGEAHGHEESDPHTWFSIHAVEQWVENIEHALSELDPAHADAYAANAEAYRGELATLKSELDALIETLPIEQRKMVTDHDSLGYFADEYNFTVVGTVLPALSTLASPSAGELARLQEQIESEGISAIFVGNTVNPDLAEQIGADTGVQVVPIYTDSLSDAAGPASSYIDFMRYDVTAIVEALR